MRITHVIESGGGSADFVLYLVRYLPQYHHTIIYSDRTFGNRLLGVKESYSNATFYFWENIQREIKLINDVKATIFLYKLLKKIDGEVVHLHSSKAGFIGRLVCFLLKKHTIYTPNGIPFLRKDISRLQFFTYLILEFFGYLLNGKVICCSKSEANEFLKKRIKCTYINNGTEIFEYPPRIKNRNQIVIATTGRATIQKNPYLFNEIAKHFENDLAYKFIWIGGGELENVLESKNIEVTGWLDKIEVMEKLSQSDIYISTALWEGLPFAVLEAMNLRKPLVLNRCVGNVDLVINDLNGFIFDTKAEAIEKIIFINENKHKIDVFGNESHSLVVNSFNVEGMANRYKEAYRSTVNE